MCLFPPEAELEGCVLRAQAAGQEGWGTFQSEPPGGPTCCGSLTSSASQSRQVLTAAGVKLVPLEDFRVVGFLHPEAKPVLEVGVELRRPGAAL